MDTLDLKLNQVFPGYVVRKDLLHQIKKGTNVPSFVLEFLLAKFCATDDPAEIKAGIAAVFETIQKHYVRPDEANRAQSLVQQQGKHKFIDKVHVTYSEKEKRHWAEMENFNSRRIAINERFYKDYERLLEGGIWAEAVVGHNDVEDDDYAFFIEELKPIQLSRFDFAKFKEGREQFTRDEWLDIVLRTIGLEPEKLTKRLKFHYLARLFPLVESNYNFIELGPRGTGKSYVFSEFSPYSTLISGGQPSTSVLFYNNARRRVGIIGYWDVVAFDEVGNMKVKDKDTIQIMKDYMANGRFSRGPADIIANASFAFIGNIDDSIEQLVHSPNHDLFKPLPPAFDLAVMHRFHTYLPGWELPENTSDLLTHHYGFIVDYLAEAFHHLARETTRFNYVKQHCRYGKSLGGRDETAATKTVCAFLKILHPHADPEPGELREYLEYALEGRRRIKEQLNKRKADAEFENIDLAYITEDNHEVIVYCPESRGIAATQSPNRSFLGEVLPVVVETIKPTTPEVQKAIAVQPAIETTLKEKHFTIHYGDIEYSYEALFGEYLRTAKKIRVEDPYIRIHHQIDNFLRFCELVVRIGTAEEIELVTGYDDEQQKDEARAKLESILYALRDKAITLKYKFDDKLHDREICLSNGWVIKIGRGFDIYQRLDNRFAIGAHDYNLRPCLETKVDIYAAL